MILRPPRPTRTATLFPYPTLFRSAYDPVREVIRQHIIETMPVGPSDHIFSIPVEARRVHSIRSAAQEAGAHPKRLRKLLHAAGYIREADMMLRSETHTSELQSLMRRSYADFCLKKKKLTKNK